MNVTAPLEDRTSTAAEPANRRFAWLGAVVLLGISVFLYGCQSPPYDGPVGHYQSLATAVEYPDVAVESDPTVKYAARPTTLRTEEEKDFWDLSLQEVVELTLQNSEVIREIGGRVVSTPGATATRLDTAIQEASPNDGVEAALSAFDAQFTSSLVLGHREPAFNNIFFGGGATSLKQKTGLFNADISKTTATGTSFSASKRISYDRNTSPANLFSSVYDVTVEGGFRHPLLQGSGVDFNRIAGPNAQPGQYNGVVLARINTDVALADFELAVRNLLSDVEQTYWELYYAYRQLDATKSQRDSSLRLWKIVEVQLRAGSEKADAEQEALVRERYYTAQARVEGALAGAGAGPLTQGVYSVERQLRLLMGLPPSDEKILRPRDEPLQVDVRFDWDLALQEAMWRRPELRRQQWQIKRRELELLAARNFGRARLDLTGLYRWRGFGDNLAGDFNVTNASALEELFGGDLQDWQLGVEYSTAIGNRTGHLAIRHAEIQLARERAVYHEQELAISHELAAAFAELDRAFVTSKTNHNRRVAAYQQVEQSEIKVAEGKSPNEFLLDALQRATTADIAYFRSLVDYNLALANLHVAQGTLMTRLGVQLSEGPWTEPAHRSASKQSQRFGPHHGHWDLYEMPAAVSVGERSAHESAPREIVVE